MKETEGITGAFRTVLVDGWDTDQDIRVCVVGVAPTIRLSLINWLLD
jgi:hypothetical protein